MEVPQNGLARSSWLLAYSNSEVSLNPEPKLGGGGCLGQPEVPGRCLSGGAVPREPPVLPGPRGPSPGSRPFPHCFKYWPPESGSWSLRKYVALKEVWFIYIYVLCIRLYTSIYIWSPPPMDPPRALIFAKVPQIPIKPMLSGDFPVTGFLTVFLNSPSHTRTEGFSFCWHLNLSLQKKNLNL